MTATATAPLTISDALEFIRSHATASDIEKIYAATKERTRNLRAVTAARVQAGANATLDGLSPKYLNGLTGTVSSIQGARGDVRLDARSTRDLRYLGARKYFISADTTEFTLRGVPLSCIVTAE